MDNKSFQSQLSQRLRCDNAATTRLLEGFGVIIREQCSNAAKVALPGFGSFEGAKHDEEVITDLASGKRMLLPPSIEVKFNVGSMLKRKIKEARK
jgi:nucleoid DNA-binding protein